MTVGEILRSFQEAFPEFTCIKKFTEANIKLSMGFCHTTHTHRFGLVNTRLGTLRARTHSRFAASLFMIYSKEEKKISAKIPAWKKICKSVRASLCSTMQLHVALGDLNGMILRLGENRPGRFRSVARVVPLDRPIKGLG